MKQIELLEIWKKNLIELENRIKILLDTKGHLNDALAQAKNSNNLAKAAELEKEIFSVNVKIDQYTIKISGLKNRVNNSENEAEKEGQENETLERELKELQEEKIEGETEASKEKEAEEKTIEKKPITEKPTIEKKEIPIIKQESIKEESTSEKLPIIEKATGQKSTIEQKKIKEEPLIKQEPIINKETGKTDPAAESKDQKKSKTKKVFSYLAPLSILLLILSVFYFSEPGITGHIVLEEKNTYWNNLNLVLNQTGNYTWNMSKAGYIESIKATGKVEGNGTVKIYIEKDGKRYLIFNNKK